MSHLSSISTSIENLDLLKKSLSSLDIVWYSENNSRVIIPQSNGHDFGFFWSGNEFEFIGDETLWEQPWSISSFIEKVQYQYIYKSLRNEISENLNYNNSVISKNETKNEIIIKLDNFV